MAAKFAKMIILCGVIGSFYPQAFAHGDLPFCPKYQCEARSKVYRHVYSKNTWYRNCYHCPAMEGEMERTVKYDFQSDLGYADTISEAQLKAANACNSNLAWWAGPDVTCEISQCIENHGMVAIFDCKDAWK